MRCLFLIPILLLVACSEREQAAANAAAGVDAMVHEPAQYSREIIAQGVYANLEWASGTPRSEWPAPTISAIDIRRNPIQYREQSERDRDSAFQGLAWLPWLAAAAATGVAAIRATGAGGPVAAFIANTLETTKHKRLKQAVARAKDGFEALVQTIERLGNEATIKDLKREISHTAPPDIVGLIHEAKERTPVASRPEPSKEV